MSDDEIISGCLADDERSQQFLYKKYHTRVSNICKKYFKDPHDVKDASQETFIKIFKFLKSFRGEGSFEGWITRIAVNTSIKKIGSIKSKREMLEKSSQISRPNFESPEVIGSLSLKEIKSIIQKLPVGYKTVFDLYSLGYSHSEISEFLQINSGTSRSQLAKARKAIAKNLNQN